MTCAHVLGLIDAGPFADYPRTHLDAARQHARGCAACARALKASTALTAELTRLPRPSPPSELTATILARLAQIEPRHSAPVLKTDAGSQPASSTREWPAWATACGGLAAGLASWGTADLGAMPATTARALVLAAGLVLYVSGLFAPLGARK